MSNEYHFYTMLSGAHRNIVSEIAEKYPVPLEYVAHLYVNNGLDAERTVIDLEERMCWLCCK